FANSIAFGKSFALLASYHALYAAASSGVGSCATHPGSMADADARGTNSANAKVRAAMVNSIRFIRRYSSERKCVASRVLEKIPPKPFCYAEVLQLWDACEAVGVADYHSRKAQPA